MITINTKVRKATHHANILGAGAKNRRYLNRSEEFEAVMQEYKRGTLHSGSGHIVHNISEAKAIALSELKRR